MSTAQDLITYTLNRSEFFLKKYLEDLPPEAFFSRPVEGMNHLAWQLGHLISVERRIVEAIRPGSSPALPEGFDAQHEMDQHSVDDPDHFLTKDEYLTLYLAQRAATQSVLASMSDDDLAAPSPIERMRANHPTVGALLTLIGIHSIVHSGQFVAVRRHQAMPIAF